MFSNSSEPFWNLAPSRTQNVNFRGYSKAPTFLLAKISARRHLRWINLKLFGITFYYAHNLPKCFAFEKKRHMKSLFSQRKLWFEILTEMSLSWFNFSVPNFGPQKMSPKTIRKMSRFRERISEHCCKL